MTLVVSWMADGSLNCAADTRLSQGETTVSETGAKIFIVPVEYRASDDLQDNAVGRFTLGFSFCGSSLIAQNTHAIAATCCQILHSRKAGAIPSAKMIATIYARVAEHVTKDINSRVVGEPLTFQGVLFGFCPVERRFKQFLLSPKIADGNFAVEVDESTVQPGDVLGMGSGAAEFDKQLRRPNSIGHHRPVLEVFQKVIDDGRVASVGGYPQFARATERGVRLLPSLAQEDGNPDGISIHVNGFNVLPIQNLEGFSYGLEAIGWRTERVAGRKALRAKGIDPDGRGISQGVKNVAAIEAALRACVSTNSPLALTDAYTLEPGRPAMGKWYCVARCENGHDTPVCEDPSGGSHNLRFTGDGHLTVTCQTCRSKVQARPEAIRQLCWNVPC